MKDRIWGGTVTVTLKAFLKATSKTTVVETSQNIKIQERNLRQVCRSFPKYKNI